MFSKDSRYQAIPDRTLVERGRTILYKALRLLPDLPASRAHVVRQAERLDLIADRYYRNAERYYRICDANPCLHPSELETLPGRTLRIPPAED